MRPKKILFAWLLLPAWAAVALELSRTPRLSFGVGRRAALASAVTTALATTTRPSAALEEDEKKKKVRLSDAELAKAVTADVVDRQFLATADFTRALYSEDATFTDEIDTYALDKFVTGTKKLFDASKSRVELTSPVVVTKDEAAFAFQETLCFNIPFLKPVVALSGKVELKRDPATGLFSSYREFWDQSPTQVLLTAFSTPK